MFLYKSTVTDFPLFVMYYRATEFAVFRERLRFIPFTATHFVMHKKSCIRMVSCHYNIFFAIASAVAALEAAVASGFLRQKP